MSDSEEHDATPSKPMIRFGSGSTLGKIINNWRQQLEDYKKSRPSPIAAASAAEARERYRQRKESEGKTVRSYHRFNHSPQQIGETHEEYQKRTHRDRQRYYRNKTTEPVRDWTDLSLLSAEEKAAHIRARNRERQQRFRDRAKIKTEPPSINSHESHGLIEWGMF
ncbi:hypothetical protein ACLBWS_16665 [Brucellaceae bacterium D45D]